MVLMVPFFKVVGVDAHGFVIVTWSALRKCKQTRSRVRRVAREFEWFDGPFISPADSDNPCSADDIS